jgi:hypothetical protein
MARTYQGVRDTNKRADLRLLDGELRGWFKGFPWPQKERDGYPSVVLEGLTTDGQKNNATRRSGLLRWIV